MPTIKATGVVPGLCPCCWLPPKRAGGIVTSRRTSSTPTPAGPWNLWALAASVATPSSWKSTGMRPTAWTASVCTGTRDRRTTSATGWIAPVSLLASISAASLVSGLIAPRNVSGSTNPSASTSGRVTPQPSSSSRFTGPATAGCSIGTDDDVTRRDPREAEDGEVVRLGPARGEDDLVAMGPEDLRDGLARPVEPPPRGAAEGVAALGVAALEPERPHRLEHERVERGRRVLVEVDRAHDVRISPATASRARARRRRAACRASPAARPRVRRRRPSSRSRRPAPSAGRAG